MRDILLAFVFILIGLFGYYQMLRLDRFLVAHNKSKEDTEEKKDGDG